MTSGYDRIARQNSIITFYDRLSNIGEYIPFLNKKLVKLLQKKKIILIQKKYADFSFQIKRVLDHTATSSEVFKLYEKGIPLIKDYLSCLKQENFLTKESLDYLKVCERDCDPIFYPENQEYCAMLDMILELHKRSFSSGKNIVGAYIFGFLPKEEALSEIQKMAIKIPQTIKLIEMGCKDGAKLEETYDKEIKD